jgi:MFS family permease
VTEPSASATSRPPDAAPPAGASPPRRGALLVIATATLLVTLDATIVNVALPTIGSRLGFSPAGLEWVVTGYSLAYGGLLLLGGAAP